ncbi:MAG: hypothetical protein ACTSUE_02030 [Promethearchaeota archaeon]
MIELIYAWFWWTTTWGIWSYWYTLSSVIFFIYYGVRILGYFFGSRSRSRSKRKKEEDIYLFYTPSSSSSEEDRMHDSYHIRKGEHIGTNDNEEEEYYDDDDEEEEEEYEEEKNEFDDPGATFDGKVPMSFDVFFSNITKWIAYICIALLSIFVLVIIGGVFITFLDKWHEERQIQHAYYQAVTECNDRSIQSEELLKACQNARREVGKSVVFGAVKKTFFEMVRSMDDCVWYLKSSPAAWLLLASVAFFIACKLLWPARDENFPMYLQWIRRSGLSNLWKSKKNSRKKRRARRTGFGSEYSRKGTLYNVGVHNPFGNSNVCSREYQVGMHHRYTSPVHIPNTSPIQVSRPSIHHANCNNTSQNE